METRSKLIVDAAYGAIVADGCFALALTLHLLHLSAAEITLLHFLCVGAVICVMLSACWVIYDQYWKESGGRGEPLVKKLHIKELERGARIEFDGQSYRVDSIDRRSGEIVMQRIGHPGSIIIQIEGQS